MIVFYVNWESIHTQKEIKMKYSLLTLQPTLNLLQFKGLQETQKLCFSALCGHTALHEIFGLIHALNPQISPYVMIAATS